MLALRLMLSETYYAQNYAGIIVLGLYMYTQLLRGAYMLIHQVVKDYPSFS